jgi:hypothetical protein
VGDLGTFRSATGDLIRCRVDPNGRLTAFREAPGRLIPCDLRVLLGAVKLSDDPDWLNDEPAATAGYLVD